VPTLLRIVDSTPSPRRPTPTSATASQCMMAAIRRAYLSAVALAAVAVGQEVRQPPAGVEPELLPHGRLELHSGQSARLPAERPVLPTPTVPDLR
jgi:hypothetical protein